MSFTDPEKNVSELHLREGTHVADLGAGVGHYAIAAGSRVGEKGRVYAVEVQKDLLQNVKTAAKEAKLENIDVIWGNIETPHGTKIADGSVDAAILANVLFQAEDKAALLKEAHRILTRGGKILLVEWTDSWGGLGPDEKDVVAESAARPLLLNAGFTFEKKFSAGDHHYGIIASKA